MIAIHFFHSSRATIQAHESTEQTLLGGVVMATVMKTVNSAPTNTARTELDSMITFHHANTRGSSCKVQDCTSLCPKNNCHPRVAPDTDHKHKLSLTSVLSDSLTNTQDLWFSTLVCTLRCSTAEWRINTNPISVKNHTVLSEFP